MTRPARVPARLSLAERMREVADHRAAERAQALDHLCAAGMTLVQAEAEMARREARRAVLAK